MKKKPLRIYFLLSEKGLITSEMCLGKSEKLASRQVDEWTSRRVDK